MLILLVWGINFLKGKNIFTRSNTYYAYFDEVDGLRTSTDVMWRGLKVGSITEISYDPSKTDKIRIAFNIPAKYHIPDNSVVTTPNTLVISGKVVNIEFGDSRNYFKDGDAIPVLAQPAFTDLAVKEFESVKEKATLLVDNVSRALDNFNLLLSEENLAHINGTLVNLNKIVATDLGSAMANLNEITASVSRNSDNIENIILNFESISDTLAAVDFTGLMVRINDTVDQLNEIASKINDGDGSVSLLLNDQELYRNLASSTDNLSLLLEDLKANPRKYINLSIFGGRNK